MLDDHFHRGKYDEITDRADAPLSDALAMLVRERLTDLLAARLRAQDGRSGGARFSRTRSARGWISSAA